METYIVIFKAVVDKTDQCYYETAEALREKALTQYGCIDFVSYVDGVQEIAISYWPSLEHIDRWKKDAQHLIAQSLGKERWYQSYSVEVAKLEYQYASEQQVK